jgi:hypothetical protein
MAGLTGNQLFEAGLGFLEQLIAAIEVAADRAMHRRNQITGLQGHVHLQMGDVLAQVFAAVDVSVGRRKWVQIKTIHNWVLRDRDCLLTLSRSLYRLSPIAKKCNISDKSHDVSQRALSTRPFGYSPLPPFAQGIESGQERRFRELGPIVQTLFRGVGQGGMV